MSDGDVDGDGAAWIEGTEDGVFRLTKSGRVVASHSLEDMFGEGITVLDGILYELSWKDDTILVYNASTMTELTRHRGVLSQFDRKEGWGLTNNGKQLIASDGTNKLYFLCPRNFTLLDSVRVENTDGAAPWVWNINELEYIDGLIFFNIWLTNNIGIFDLQTRKVLAWLDCSEVSEKQRSEYDDLAKDAAEKNLVLPDELLDVDDNVLNGITFIRSRGQNSGKHMIVTGKRWSKMYEIDFTCCGPT